VVRCYGLVYQFLGVLKNIKFHLKIQRGKNAFDFTEKRSFMTETGRKFVFHNHKVHILAQLDVVTCKKIRGFKKYLISLENKNELAFSITKNIFLWLILAKNPYIFALKPIFQLG
jgi:hypothetical protein